MNKELVLDSTESSLEADKYLYIFTMEDGLTDSYHSGGSVLVIAPSTTEAKHIIEKYLKENNIGDLDDKERAPLDFEHPIYVVKVPTDTEDRILIFPDAGCC